MVRLRQSLAAAMALVVTVLAPHGVAGASVGVNATHIVVGQTAPLTGLSKEYGIRLAAGLQVAFGEANAAGGIQGRNLTLFTLDDGYVATNSVANFPALQNQTLLLACCCGTAVNTALLPLILTAGIPNVGPWTGALVTRFPFHEEVVNVRASYPDEMVVQAILLVQQLRVHRVACFYQNDGFGLTALNGMAAALNYVGLQLAVTASYATGSLAIEAAVDTIAGYPQPVQAVVMASLEAQNVKFLQLFRQDNRTDPNCTFLFISTGATSSFATKIGPQNWPNLYFTHIVPPLDTPGLPIVAQFQTAVSLYMPSGISADHMAFEGYMVGRLIADVLRGIPGEITRKAFLDQLYNTRLYAFGSMLAGLYSRNFSGCQDIVCASSIGLRAIFPATLHPVTGAMHYQESLGFYKYPVTELTFPVTKVVRPLLFGQLLPVDDPVWRRVAEVIGQGLQDAFATLNAAGGVRGRPVQLIQQYYSGDPAVATAALLDRYVLLAMVGSVVNRSSALRAATAQIGTYQTDRQGQTPVYNASEVMVQGTLALELMALAAFAVRLGQPIHLRAAATATGQSALQAMVMSLNTLQQQPATSQLYATADEALQEISSGTVIAVGTDAAVQAWFLALATRPQLRLLTTSPRATHLFATLAAGSYPQASRFHYPSMFSALAAPAAGPEVQDAVQYGQLLGAVLQTVLKNAANVSRAYSTTAEVLNSWYGAQYKVNGATIGPYYSATCAEDAGDCECNQGVRQLAVLTAAHQALPVAYRYASPTCGVAYQPLLVPPTEGPWYIWVAIGSVGAVGAFAVLGFWLSRRGRRDNSTAPRNESEPFCIVFTDIQASTHLWATVPDVMSTALSVHHDLIRQAIAKHRLYEVKTIGDSFMCATSCPRKAVDFALALQHAFFEYDWGTDRIDQAYLTQLLELQGDVKGPCYGVDHGWNGIRVRVGIHHGLGSVHLDPVSKGYDYYGTVVNTAARVEAVCHGGQIGITQDVYDELEGEFPGAEVTDLGEQILRGLCEKVRLYQLVPSELSARWFPPLRLERAAAVEIEVRPPSAKSRVSFSRSTVAPTNLISVIGPTPGRGFGAQSVAPSVACTMVAAPNWVETHPMVLSGQLTADELTVRYLTVQKALSTLLETQSQRVREASLRAFCERLHVRNAGSDGPRLEETLNGIVQRVLPAALAAVNMVIRRTSGGHQSLGRASSRASSVHFPDCATSDVNEHQVSLQVPGAAGRPKNSTETVEDV